MFWLYTLPAFKESAVWTIHCQVLYNCKQFLAISFPSLFFSFFFWLYISQANRINLNKIQTRTKSIFFVQIWLTSYKPNGIVFKIYNTNFENDLALKFSPLLPFLSPDFNEMNLVSLYSDHLYLLMYLVAYF